MWEKKMEQERKATRVAAGRNKYGAIENSRQEEQGQVD